MRRYERKMNARELPPNIIGPRPKSIKPLAWELLNIYAHELMRKRAENDGKTGNSNRDL